ncbi:hypothetical protein Pfo_020436 [Paulownia fortunei]|nr:hypothetical protein Pfo_020436 [Paulownia fortunei]
MLTHHMFDEMPESWVYTLRVIFYPYEQLVFRILLNWTFLICTVILNACLFMCALAMSLFNGCLFSRHVLVFLVCYDYVSALLVSLFFCITFEIMPKPDKKCKGNVKANSFTSND